MQFNTHLKVFFIVIILVILFIVWGIFSNKNTESKLNDFETICIHGYLENDVLDVFTLYKLSGKIKYNETEIFQSKLKQALDTYFSNNSKTEVSASTVVGMVDSNFTPKSLDFNGIVVSDYEYNSERNVFVKSPGAYSNISGIEASASNFDFSENKASVKSIEKTSDNKYKVIFDIVNFIHNNSIENSGEAVISIQDDVLKVDSCIIND